MVFIVRFTENKSMVLLSNEEYKGADRGYNSDGGSTCMMMTSRVFWSCKLWS